MAKIADKVLSILNPSVHDLGYELLGVEYVPSGKHSVLRLYIDSDEGIGVDDCETVSRQLMFLHMVLMETKMAKLIFGMIKRISMQVLVIF